MDDSIVGPLIPVIVDKILEENLHEDELSTEQQVTFKFLKH
jgi:hypothetical protein